jgi:hypothetical protein
MGAATSAFDRARRTQAKNDVIQIATAVNAFYTEYGRYPVTVTSTLPTLLFGSGTTPPDVRITLTTTSFFNVLRNITSDAKCVRIESSANCLFVARRRKEHCSNREVGIATDNRFYDPWGSQYAVLIDHELRQHVNKPVSQTPMAALEQRRFVSEPSLFLRQNGALGGGSASSPFTSEGGSPARLGVGMVLATGPCPGMGLVRLA